MSKFSSMNGGDKARFISARFGIYFVMAVVLVISLYPIIWVFISSFKEVPGGLSLPEVWVTDGYQTIFTKLNIGSYFLNSIIVSGISTVISVLIVSMSAYVSARMEFKGKALVTGMFASTILIPTIAISFPIYRLVRDMGLYDSLLGLILVYSGLGVAVTFFIIRSYFLTIPKEMEEAAKIDGCGYTRTFFTIMVPLAKPGLMTAGVLAFLNNWNEFYFATLLLESKSNMTIPALLGQFRTAYAMDFNGMFSAVVVAIVPTIVVFCLASKVFVRSLTEGAIKG